MASLNRLTIIWFASLLLTSTQLFATSANHAEQLKTELEKLQSETQAIEEQIQTEQAQIEQLKYKIEFFRLRNKVLDQHLTKEIHHYENRASSASE